MFSEEAIKQRRKAVKSYNDGKNEYTEELIRALWMHIDELNKRLESIEKSKV